MRLSDKLRDYINKFITARGITKRWLTGSFALVILAVIALELTFSVAIKNFFYSGIRQGILERSQVTARYFYNFSTDSASADFLWTAQAFADDFEYKDKLELQVIDQSGSIVTSSLSRFSPSQNSTMPDYTSALTADDGLASWIGYNIDGEHIMCITKMLPAGDGETQGAVRFLVSLEPADRQIFIFSACIMLIGTFILFFTLVSSSYFINSIVSPVREIGVTARRIAEGDFNTRLEKKFDDEIGELCDTVNYMAGELALAEKVKNDFISSVSHELRTPLTAIKGWSETIRASEESDKQTVNRGMDFIIRESERLSSLVEDLLDFSRMQDGRFSLTLDRMDILAELGEAVYMFTEREKKEGKTLIYNEPENLPTVLGDMNRLRQVFLNILDNSFKYTDKGDSITITAALVDNEVQITVADTGCGISSKDLPHIKEKFYKANLTRQGFGIGLAVADEIISLHSGKLELESEEGVGTTVIITLPIIFKRADEFEQTEKQI